MVKKDYSDLKEELSDKDKELKSLKDKWVNGSTKERKILNDQIDFLEEEITKLKKDRKETRKDVDYRSDLKNELFDEDSKLRSVEDKWMSANSREREIIKEQEMNPLKDKIKELKEELKEAREDALGESSRLKDMRKEFTHTIRTNAIHEHDHNSLIEKHYEDAKELGFSKKDLKNMVSRALGSELPALRKEINGYREQMKESLDNHRNTDNEKEKEQHQEEYLKVQKQLAQTETRAAKAQEKAAEYEVKRAKEEVELFSTLGKVGAIRDKIKEKGGVKGAARAAKDSAWRGVKRGAYRAASFDVSKGLTNAVTNFITYDRTFADWIIILGFFFHLTTAVSTDWTFNIIPRSVITWEFSMIMIMTVLALVGMKDLKTKFTKIGVLVVLFMIDWQWGNIIGMIAKTNLADPSAWFLSKLIWPTWIIGGIVLAQRSGEKKSLITKLATGVLILFWVFVGISQSNIAGAVYDYAAGGITEEEGAAGVSDVGEKTIEAIFGPELLREAKDLCFTGGDITAYRPEILGRSECVQKEYNRLVKKKADAQELERITKARKDLIDKDKIEITEFKVSEVISYTNHTQMKAILKIKSNTDKISIIPGAIFYNPKIHPKRDLGEKGTYANKMIVTHPLESKLQGITDELEYGLDITATDLNKKLTGDNNKIIFNVEIKDIDAQTDFSSIFMYERAYEELVRPLEKEFDMKNEFTFYKSVFNKQGIIIPIRDIYPNNKKESLFREKLAGTNLGVANEHGPVVIIKKENRNTLSLGLKIFNTRVGKNSYNGKIIHIESIKITLPHGMTLVDGADEERKCQNLDPNKKSSEGGSDNRNTYWLDVKALNKQPILDKINTATEDKPKIQIPIQLNCRIRIDPEVFFSKTSTSKINLDSAHPKQLIKWAKAIAFMKFDYQISKTGTIDAK